MDGAAALGPALSTLTGLRWLELDDNWPKELQPQSLQPVLHALEIDGCSVFT